ncbi:hypothetical protein K501DRAFT_277646 [Backusella circina FSU 941]|nr:hypothetical protein K501DRAFT_277646 [Backusella circina FSU 941]
MHVKPIVFSLTILSTIFVNAAPVGELTGSSVGGVGRLFGNGAGIAGPSLANGARSLGNQENAGINPSFVAYNTAIGDNNAIQAVPQAAAGILSVVTSSFGRVPQMFAGKARNGDSEENEDDD